jgi:acetyl esterase/lipase
VLLGGCFWSRRAASVEGMKLANEFVPKTIRPRITCTLLAGSLLLTAACQGTESTATVKEAAAREQRGQIVSSEPLVGMSQQQVGSYLGKLHYTTRTPRYGVDAYRVVYRTVDPSGKPTTASGLVVLPRNGDRRLRTAAYEHGTNPVKADAATTSDASYDRATAIFLAAGGLGTIAPDYIGLGLGPGRPAYMDHASEAATSLDLLTAAERVAAEHGRVLERRVRVTGFSQGGPAAMAFGRELQKRGRLAALAPVSGPYDVEHAEIPAMFTPGALDPKESVLYIGYWLTSMNRLHHFYGSPGEFFQKPYDATIEELFSGDQPIEKIVAGTPGDTGRLLTPKAVQALKRPTGPLARAMRENDDTCRWRPSVPIRIYAAHGDRDVAIANSRSCARDLRARGVNAPVIDVGDLQHVPSALASMPRVLDWFTAL